MRLEEQIGQHLRDRRTAAKLSQEALAERAELNEITIRRMEKGSSLTLANLERVADALSVPLVDLLRDEEESPSPSHVRLDGLMQRVSKQPDRAVEMICDVIEVLLNHQ